MLQIGTWRNPYGITNVKRKIMPNFCWFDPNET